MEIIFEQGWILFIAVTIANGLIFKIRSTKYIAANPELKQGYDKYLRGWLVYGNIPWVIIGFGNLSGMTSSLFDYFNPGSMNPIVLFFHASIVALWILGFYWIYFNNGAEFIEKHPGLITKKALTNDPNPTANQVKIFFPLMLFGGIAGMAMMWIMDIPAPKF